MQLKPKTFVRDLLSEPWAMEPARLHEFVTELIEGAIMIDAETIRAAKGEEKPEGPGYETKDGVAHVPIKGTILKEVPCVFRYFGIDATSTRETEEAIKAALADDDVERIQLEVESAGGTVTGVQELADFVFNVREKAEKPITARVEDMAASAAYWIASQAESIDSNKTAMIGSIGVYTVIRDSSRMFEDAGVKTHVVSTHELKGIGVVGAEVTKPQLADIQRKIDSFFGYFKEAVSRGRGLEEAKVNLVATGQVWLGVEAKGLGLIDKIRESATVGNRQPVVNQKTPQVGKEMEIAMDKTSDPTANQAAEEMKAELEQLRAESEANRATIAELKTQQLKSLMEQYEDRVSPASKEAVEKLGATMKPEEFQAYLEALPQVTRPDRLSVDVDKDDNKANQDQFTEADKALAKTMGVTPAHHRKLEAYGEHISGVKMNGKVILRDGREVERDEVDAALGLN